MQQAQLPNITGSCSLYPRAVLQTQGAFSFNNRKYGINKRDWNEGGSSDSNYSGLTLDASSVSSVYKDGHNEVTPMNYTIRVWKRTA